MILAVKSSIEPISVPEIREAERSIVKYVQEKHFKEEIESLKRNQDVVTVIPSQRPKEGSVKRGSSIFGLDPVQVDRILVVGGRFGHASLPEDVEREIILPKDHHVTNLIVWHYDFASSHSEREYVLSLLQSKFWVIRANSLVLKLLTNCFSCRRRQNPVCCQKMADLPKERVTPGQPPFSHLGIDYFSPFMVKQERSQVKR